MVLSAVGVLPVGFVLAVAAGVVEGANVVAACSSAGNGSSLEVSRNVEMRHSI